MTLLRAHLVLPDADRPVEVTAGTVTRLPSARAARAVAGLDDGDRRAGHRVVLAGRRIDRLHPARRVAAGLGVVVDAPVAGDVSVLDHLAAVVPPARARSLLAQCPLLAGRDDDPAGVLSGGERRALAWLTCLATTPKVVVLDAATRGFDPDARAWADEHVSTWLAAGVGLLVHPTAPLEEGWCASPGGPQGR
jgi:ABC-type branched-subunit amino acid transport system ATPase component